MLKVCFQSVSPKPHSASLERMRAMLQSLSLEADLAGFVVG